MEVCVCACVFLLLIIHIRIMLCFRRRNSSVICQCYFTLGWVWINFIPGNNYWRLQTFFPPSVIPVPTFESIHCGLLNKHNSQTPNTSAVLCFSSRDVYDRRSIKKAVNLKRGKKILFCLLNPLRSIHTSPDPGDPSLLAFTLPGLG